LLLLAGRGLADLPAVLVVGLVGVVGTRFILAKLAEPQDRAFLAKIVVAGLLIRVGLSLLAHYLLPVAFFAPDQFTYQDVGWRTLLYWRGQGTQPWQVGGTMEVGYFYWNALLYFVFGFRPVAAKLFNCFFGIWASMVAYRIAGELAGQGVARNTAVLTALFPSLVLWSTQNLRDTIVLLLLVVIVWLTLRLRQRPTAGSFVGLVLVMALLAVVRDYMAVMVVFALTGSFFITPRRGLVANVFIGLALFGVAVAAYSQLGLGAQWVEAANFEAIQAQRTALAIGGTAFQPQVVISTPVQGLQYLPIGLLFFLLAPFPWQLGSMLSLMTLPEMLIWYGLLFFVAYGGLFLLRERFSRVEPILLFVSLTTVIYALVEGNAGTAYRHRAQVVIFLLIFAGVGLELWRLRRQPKPAAPTGD
ncbi:MAG: glycosyltransferase family 39 protein, partial [Gemmatimonadetes bacterium]|nr:glycosyltransferase family 39 protein [Gemmatimonadota bacterium]